MISPPPTCWPEKTLTPRYFGFESRPLRLDPSPFLCAMSVVSVVSTFAIGWAKSEYGKDTGRSLCWRQGRARGRRQTKLCNQPNHGRTRGGDHSTLFLSRRRASRRRGALAGRRLGAGCGPLYRGLLAGGR